MQAAVHGNVGYVANCYNQPSSGVWHHLAFVFDKSQTGASEVKFYLDGVLQTATRSLATSTNTNNFGSNTIYVFSRGGTQSYAAGTVDELRLYSSALTGTQIQQVYSATLSSLAVTPVNPTIPRVLLSNSQPWLRIAMAACRTSPICELDFKQPGVATIKAQAWRRE